MRQGTIWDLLYPRKRIEKPIRLIEFFAGIGAQHKALSQLTEVESWRICEWAFNSYCSYNAIHIKDSTDYSEGKSRDELIQRVRGTSSNYNEPIPDSQLKKKPIEWLRKAYNNIVATHNLVNIMEVHGRDLGIVDTDRYEYVLTYSFPCQDLSLAGKMKGMSVSQKDGGTRSGLLWEVKRILSEIEREREPLPQVLVMENVPEVIGTANIEDFKKWGHRLEQMGYTNYVEVLNAKDYGIPQNRRRCFMVSLLGGYAYDFPMKMKRRHVLKDLLERHVDKKYYLSDEIQSYFINHSKDCEEQGKGYRFKPQAFEDSDLARTVTTKAGNRMDDNFIIEEESQPRENFLNIRNKTKKGYLEACEGDGIDINMRMGNHRGTVQKGLAQTLKTRNDVGVVVNEKQAKVIPDSDSNLRIRKLTPKECIRLMGFTDGDYDAMVGIGMTDSAIYHVAGDSIVVTVLMAIFGEMLGIDYRGKIGEYVESEVIGR